ncbi:MAG TPA: inositol monophosphatase family protein [Pseudogracilibacillus sp.]|nr:inositol monophosphatase family protein [Pseudogracilibacillus sp.]
MDNIEREILSNRLRSWILQAGKIIREKINDPLVVSTKSNPKDLVTEMDREVEFFFASKIKRFYPHHLLLGEEGYGHSELNKTDTIWIIDPIDGTMNFVHQKQDFAISIGIYHQGIGEIGYIYDVMNNNLFGALRGNGAYKNNVKLPSLEKDDLSLDESMVSFSHRWLMKNNFVNERTMQQLVRDVRGVRSYGSAALGFARVAEGALDAYITMRLEPWDIAAGRIIVNEVGGITTDVRGKEIGLLERSSVISAHPAIHERLVKRYLRRAIKRGVR